MATVEEERAKVKGINIPTPLSENVGAGIRQGMGNIITGANEVVRNTSPIRDIYNLAEGVSGFFRGATGAAQATPMVAPTAALQEAPREYVPNPASPVAPTPIPGNAERSIRNTQAWLAVNKPGYAPGGPVPQAPAPVAPAQDAGIRREVINGNVSTSFGGDIAPKTTVQPGYAPQLMAPVSRVEPKIIGWKGQNAVYADPAAEIAARNQGINAYNSALVNKFGAENTLYSTVMGGVPLQQAQASLAGTSAAEMPGENLSQQGLRSAQAGFAEAQAGQVGKGVWQTVVTEEPGTQATGFNPTKTAYQVHSVTGEQRPVGGIRQPKSVPEMLAGLSTENKSAVVKHFGKSTDVTPEAVSAYIKTLQ